MGESAAEQELKSGGKSGDADVQESLPAMRGAEHHRKRAPRRTMPARGVGIAGR